VLNSADFRSKTARAQAGSPCRGKPSRDKGSMHGLSRRCRRAYETSRSVPSRIVSSSEGLANRRSFSIAPFGMVGGVDDILE